MTRQDLYAPVLLLVGVVGCDWIMMHENYQFDTMAQLKESRQSGWMPARFPSSCTNVFLRADFDNGRAWARAECPTEEIDAIIGGMKKIDWRYEQTPLSPMYALQRNVKGATKIDEAKLEVYLGEFRRPGCPEYVALESNDEAVYYWRPQGC